MPKKNIKKLHLPDADIELYENCLDQKNADNYLYYLINNINWKQESMNLYGESVLFSRLMSWYGDVKKSYRFSGKIQEPNNWNDDLILSDIKKRLEELYGDNFNSVLLNLYRNEKDSISWHSDNEKDLGCEPIIYSLSLGCERIFKLKHVDGLEFEDPFNNGKQSELFNNKPKKIKLLKIILKHNSLLIMKGRTQDKWKHSIDKIISKKAIDKFKHDKHYPSRVNLTFRHII
jgi:alkylated DNA repair dioxygenase AlkB